MPISAHLAVICCAWWHKLKDRGKGIGWNWYDSTGLINGFLNQRQLSYSCPRLTIVRSIPTEYGLWYHIFIHTRLSNILCSERDAPPRFAQPGTFEEEFARRWKALDDLEKQQRDQLEKSIKASREKLESEMENSIHEHQAMLMKQGIVLKKPVYATMIGLDLCKDNSDLLFWGLLLDCFLSSLEH